MAESHGIAFFQFVKFVTGMTTLVEGVNPTSSGVILRLYALRILTSAQVSATGALVTFSLYRTTYAQAPGINAVRSYRIVPMMLEVGTDPPSSVAFWTGRNVATTGVPFRVQSVVVDDINLNSGHNTLSYMTMEVPWSVLWQVDRGVDVQPLVSRAGEGFAVTHAGALNATWCDVEAEFSVEDA